MIIIASLRTEKVRMISHTVAFAIRALLVIKVAVSAQTTDYVPLKDVVASLDSGYTVFMGGIANVNKYLGDPVYDDLLCKNYALLTAENGCKWHYTQDDDPLYRS